MTEGLRIERDNNELDYEKGSNFEHLVWNMIQFFFKIIIISIFRTRTGLKEISKLPELTTIQMNTLADILRKMWYQPNIPHTLKNESFNDQQLKKCSHPQFIHTCISMDKLIHFCCQSKTPCNRTSRKPIKLTRTDKSNFLTSSPTGLWKKANDN